MKSEKIHRIINIIPGEIEIKVSFTKAILFNLGIMLLFICIFYLIISITNYNIFPILFFGIIFTSIIVILILNNMWYLKITDNKYLIAKKFFKEYTISFDDLIDVRKNENNYFNSYIIIEYNSNGVKKSLGFQYFKKLGYRGTPHRLIQEDIIDEFLGHFERKIVEIEVKENILTTDLEQFGILSRIAIILFITLSAAFFLTLLYSWIININT